MKLHLKIILLFLFISSCAKDNWEAIVYDDRNDLSEYKILGVYDSLDDCRTVAVSYLYSSELESIGDYECGLNCEFREGWADTRICEVTEQ